jgi:hypothetical protein
MMVFCHQGARKKLARRHGEHETLAPPPTISRADQAAEQHSLACFQCQAK